MEDRTIFSAVNLGRLLSPRVGGTDGNFSGSFQKSLMVSGPEWGRQLSLRDSRLEFRNHQNFLRGPRQSLRS